MVTVSRDHEDVHTIGDRLHDFAFDAPTPAEQRRIRAAETSRGRGEQVRCFVAGDGLVRLGWPAPGGAASEESDCCRACRLRDV
jgi:hypothetical protein